MEARAVNETHLLQDLVFETRVVTANGALYPADGPLFGPRPVTLPPFSSRSAVLSHAVPAAAPPGVYVYRATLNRPGGEAVAVNEASFTIFAGP